MDHFHYKFPQFYTGYGSAIMSKSDPFTELGVISMQIQGRWPVAFFGNEITLIQKTWSALITISLAFFTATMFADIFLHWADLTAVVENLMISFLIFCTVVKSIVFLIVRKTVEDLVKHVGELSLRVKRSGDSKSLKIFNEYATHSRILTLGFWTAAATSITCFSIAPLTDVISGMEKQPSRLIFRAWNPFGDLWSGYFMQLILIYLTGVVASSYSTFMAVLIIVPTCELKILSIELENMIQAKNPDDQNPKVLRGMIVTWVKNHLKVMRYVERLDGILNHLLLLDFIIYSGIFCTIFFQYIIVGFKFESLVPTVYFAGMINMIMLMYWTGNEIILNSEMLASSAYNSIWYKAPTWYQTSMQIIIQRCQKPLKLRAWRIYNISLETFLKIMSAAYSYFAILRHIYLNK